MLYRHLKKPGFPRIDGVQMDLAGGRLSGLLARAFVDIRVC